MLIDYVDQLNLGRRAYVRMTGRRWVKIAADLTYDTPSPYSGGTATMDDTRSFYGALDRYDFELMGKKEKFIYCNSHMLADMNACPNAKMISTKGYPNADCVRWELHRVWSVKAALKPGFRHLYPKRMFYWDEDGYFAGQGENYDADGKVFRIAHNIYYPFYESEGAYGSADTHLDLKMGAYGISGATGCDRCGWRAPKERFPKNMFDPSAMAGAGIR